MSLKQDILNLKVRAEEKYEEYQSHITNIGEEYDSQRDKFNQEINLINTERFYLRDEINVLYKFLESTGGSLREEKRISVFDFENEDYAPRYSKDSSDLNAINESYEKKKVHMDVMGAAAGSVAGVGVASSIASPAMAVGAVMVPVAPLVIPLSLIGLGVGTFINNKKNKEEYEKLLTEAEKKELEYEADIAKRCSQLKFLMDAIEMAKIYRNIIAIVRDTIKERIIPEMELIQAFLYADAIRELVLDGEEPKNVEVFGISEYKGTTQDVHYQFVSNSFDFYTISTAFFKQKVMTDILEDRVVTEEEKKQFSNQVEAIKRQVDVLKENKVI